MRELELVVVYDKRVIVIPFKKLGELDEFTSFYQNDIELGKVISDLFDLKMKNIVINKIYIKKTHRKQTGREYTKYLPVKYMQDKMAFDTIRAAYIDYFLSDMGRFESLPVGMDRVRDNYLRKYNKANIDVTDVYKIVNLFLDNNYERYREAYFTLLANGYEFKDNNVKINDNSVLYTNIVDEAYTLAYYAGMSISELSNLVDRYHNEYSKGHRR